MRRKMTMARSRSMTSIDTEIGKIEAELEKLQKKEEVLTAKLRNLQKQKQEYESKQIMDAFRKSGKSLEELMTFFDV